MIQGRSAKFILPAHQLSENFSIKRAVQIYIEELYIVVETIEGTRI
jgi:hypothetical protein